MIYVENVHKTYNIGSADVYALRGVTFRLDRGDICTITGKSGSGKSTLLNSMAGVETISKGRIYIAGKQIDRMNQNDLVLFRQKHVGFIFQSFNLIQHYTALENIALPLMFQGVPQTERNRRSHNLLEELGISHLAHHKPSQMSGGEQQRVAIARALVTEPSVVFADEPTGNLDTVNTTDIMRILCNQVKRTECTLVMVTHDMNLTKFADRTIVLQDGKIVSNI